MFDLYQKRKFRAIFNSRLTQGFLLLLVVFLGWQTYERYAVAVEVNERRAAAEQMVSHLTERRDNLEQEVQYLQTERGIESALRRQFDVALPGEDVVVILSDDTESAVTPLATSTKQETRKVWWFWW